MKIAIFRTDATEQDTKSYNSQELGLAKGFCKLGYSVDILGASQDGILHKKNIDGTEGRGRIISIPYKELPILDEPLFIGVKKVLKAGHYDYVQINEEGNIASFLIALACRSLRIPFGLYQGMYRVLPGRLWTLYERVHALLFRPILKNSAKAVLCKTSMAQNFLRQKGYPKVEVIPVGLDFEKFQMRENCNWRERLGILSSDRIALYVGVLEPRRHPDFLLDMASIAAHDTVFVFVGDGPDKKSLEERIQKENLSNVRVLGKLNQTELPSLYEQSDILLLPSEYEIYGMVVIEALYFGLPVISTPTAGPSDILMDNKLGTLIQELDSEKWLKAMDMLLADFGTSSHRSARMEYTKSHFDWAHIAKDYKELIAPGDGETQEGAG